LGSESSANTSGDYRVSIGAESQVQSSQSVALGYKASIGSSAGNSVAIGSGSSVSSSNAVAIGNGASVSADDEVVIGNTAIASIGGNVNWTATSDQRVKNNIQENVPGLEFIEALRPVTYNLDGQKMNAFYNMDSDSSLTDAYQKQSETLYSGFLAQEVDSIAKSMGYEFSGVKVPENDSTQLYGLRYAEFTVPLVQAVKELSARVEVQEELIQQYEYALSKVDNQQALIQQYEYALSELNNRLENLENQQTTFSATALNR